MYILQNDKMQLNIAALYFLVSAVSQFWGKFSKLFICIHMYIFPNIQINLFCLSLYETNEDQLSSLFLLIAYPYCYCDLPKRSMYTALSFQKFSQNVLLTLTKYYLLFFMYLSKCLTNNIRDKMFILLRVLRVQSTLERQSHSNRCVLSLWPQKHERLGIRWWNTSILLAFTFLSPLFRRNANILDGTPQIIVTLFLQ